jgi:hypothetical protein
VLDGGAAGSLLPHRRTKVVHPCVAAGAGITVPVHQLPAAVLTSIDLSDAKIHRLRGAAAGPGTVAGAPGRRGADGFAEASARTGSSKVMTVTRVAVVGSRLDSACRQKRRCR